MAQYIEKSALVAEIERRIKERDFQMKSGCWVSSTYVYEDLLDFINTSKVKEIPETAHTQNAKKIKKLCEVKRYDENGKVYSVMLPDTRLFMNKINDIIEAIEDLDLRLQTIEALNIDYGKCKTEILEKVRKVSHLIANKGNVNFKRIDERLRKIEQRIGG